MAAVIVNFCQVSPVDSFLGLVDEFDHPTSRTIAQGLDFDDSLSTKIIWRKLSKLLTYVPNRSDEKAENLSTSITHYINI